MTTYQYDKGQTADPTLNRSQVTGETSTRGTAYTNLFTYDGGATGGPGNATAFKSGTANRAYNADNQITNTGFAYDGNGSPTAYNAQALAFDPEQRMASYGTLQTDGYDGDGLRAWKQKGAAGTRVYFLYDGGRPVGEFGSTGSFQASNTFGPDGLLTRQSSAGRVYYAYDERGDVSQRTGSTGAVTGSDLYDGYGARQGTAAVQPDPFGFGGQWGYYTDVETGLILCTHRFYDPQAGRFVTRDPIGYAGGVNLYGYVENDPIDWIDPEGLSRRPGKTPPSSWPPPPPSVVGSKPKWDPNGYWKGDHDVVWDPTGHGAAHWDEDQRPGNKKGGGRRWGPTGTPIPFSCPAPTKHQPIPGFSPPPPEYQPVYHPGFNPAWVPPTITPGPATTGRNTALVIVALIILKIITGPLPIP